MLAMSSACSGLGACARVGFGLMVALPRPSPWQAQQDHPHVSKDGRAREGGRSDKPSGG